MTGGFNRFALILVLALAATGRAAAQEPASPGVVREVLVHGNHTTPDADILGLVGDVVGQPATPAVIDGVTTRLRASGRFEGVEVRKRFRSIENPDDILLVVVVDERPGVSDLDLTPGPMKRFSSSAMFLPVLNYEDGYGFTYGARVSFVDRLGPSSRISVPLTWGGTRQAKLQFERAFGPARIVADGGIARRENPHYEFGDSRTGAHVRGEGPVARWLRVGAGAGIEDVDYSGGVKDRLTRAGADVTVDTRVDPAFPRNAVHALVGWERLSFDAGSAVRTTADLRGYIGLFGQTVLALRGVTITADQPLPVYEQALLGGSSTLRGYKAGYAAGDNLAAVSAELRVPLTAPLSIGRFGMKLFYDAGTVYASGLRLQDQRLDAGYGAGLYLHLTMLSLSLDVAHADGGGTRAHFGMGVTFK